MTTLHDRLAELATDAPPGGPVPDLWERGRRYHRQRRAGTLVIAATVVLGLLALGSLDWWRARPEPAPSNGTPALPQKVWTPSKWLPGTDDAGPLGPLAVVQQAGRGSWAGDHEAFVGISALTGEYRFLDLPDVAPASVALAPDGLHVAYWMTGETSKSPNSQSGPVVGVAVYDTRTGEVVRQVFPTEHGLAGEDLVWADSDRLVLRFYQWMGGDADDDMAQSSANDDSGLLMWTPGVRGELTHLGPGEDVENSTGHGQLLLSGDHMTWLDVDRPDERVRLDTPQRSYGNVAAVDDGGTRVAAPRGNRNPNTIAIEVVHNGRVVGSEVPNSTATFRVVAWLDHNQVVVLRRVKGYQAALAQVDIHSGESKVIMRYPHNNGGGGLAVARDLLDVPSVARSAPPAPLDPRVVAVGATVLVLGGFGALVLWRRRVRP